MSKIQRIYENPNNGGRELVIRDGEKFYINSDWGDGFCRPNSEISREGMANSLRYTKAPVSVVSDILN